MKPRRYFPVYRSASHSYLRFLLLAFPLLAFYLAQLTGFSFLYLVAAGTLCLCLPFLVMLCAVVRIDTKGVHLIRLLHKTVSLPWADIRYCGVLTVPYLGSAAPAQLQYFSRESVSSAIAAQKALPRLTEKFLYAAAQPGLQEAVELYRVAL